MNISAPQGGRPSKRLVSSGDFSFPQDPVGNQFNDAVPPGVPGYSGHESAPLRAARRRISRCWR